MRLISKVILAISALLLLVMVPFSYLNVRAMKRLLFEEAVSEADTISDTIIKTTHYQMLEDDRARVYQMIQEAGKQKGIEHIRMIAKDGKIIFSADSAEVGAYVDKTASACDMCHSSERPLREVSPMSRSRVFEGSGGEQVLGITKAIYNQESCASARCHFHPPDQNILGVLDTIVSLEPMREQTREYAQRLVVLTVAMLLVIGAFLTLLVQRLINRPIGEILDHMRRVGDLELDSDIAVRTSDEIGSLANAFNDMIAKLRIATHALEESARTLESKVQARTKELARTQEQLVRSDKLASLGKIVAGIAHELNNPLTGILVLAAHLEESEELDPERKEDLKRIVDESGRCANIVQGLLDFSRESIPRKRRARIEQIMDKTLALIGSQSMFQNVEIKQRYDRTLPDVMADPNQMEQVFVNLLLNAAQAMSEGGTLAIEVDTAGRDVLVRVRDSGCGIPPQDIGKIFDPFFTTREIDGTGLGLSVSYGIVQNHGGSIEVESRPGLGTTFTVRLPIAEFQRESGTG